MNANIRTAFDTGHSNRRMRGCFNDRCWPMAAVATHDPEFPLSKKTRLNLAISVTSYLGYYSQMK